MKKLTMNEAVLLNWQDVDSKNWLSIAREITAAFFDLYPDQLNDLERSWDKKDLEALRRSAHKLKSTCGNVGAEKAHAMLDEIEKLSEERNVSAVRPIITKVRRTFEETHVEVEAFIKKYQAA